MLACLLSLLGLGPVALSALVWTNNFLYGAVILVLWWFLSIKKRGAAKFALLPMSLAESLPPYPNWLFIDNAGTYHFGFTPALITSSLLAGMGLFVFYAAIFFGIYVLLEVK